MAAGPGAIGGRGTQEKRITLAAALELKRQLEAGGRCRVALTRSRDVFIPLGDRIETGAAAGGGAVPLAACGQRARGAGRQRLYPVGDRDRQLWPPRLARRENEADRAGGLRLPSVRPRCSASCSA